LSEYTHIEAELAFLTFEEMLVHIEDTVASPVGGVDLDLSGCGFGIGDTGS
jgi:aspartyl/asparaginyl-tRNA synthetase